MLKIKNIKHAKKDQNMMKPGGEVIYKLPIGVHLKDIQVHTDDRGMVFELYDKRWTVHKAPLVFSYLFTIRPGIIKGWGVHKKHDDRYVILFGEMETVLYDGREDSKTFGMVSKIYLTEQKRQLLTIPTGVWHADRNIGQKDVVAVNFPTIVYNHTDPDKYRLPVDTDKIPYKFPNPVGG